MRTPTDRNLLNRISSYNRIRTFFSMFVVIGVLVPGFVIVSGHAAGPSFQKTASLNSAEARSRLNATSYGGATGNVVPASPLTSRFVSTTGSNAGNDCSNAGSPCQTITYAVSQAVAGDTINVAAGTYTDANILIDKNLTISGAGASTTIVQVKAAPGVGTQGRVFNVGSVNPAVVVTLSGLTMKNGYLLGVPPSNPAVGAGILNRGTLTVLNCAIRDNRVDTYGFGTGILSSGTLTLTNTAITGGVGNNDGAAINLNVGSNATITNCTISGNSNLAGGALSIDTNGTITIRNSTITNNTTAGSGGGIQVYTGHTATVNVGNTIIAGNGAPTGPNVNGTIVSAGYNLIGDGTGSSGFTAIADQVGTTGSPINPKLAALAFNGGPTQTHALLPGSPAIDKGMAFSSTTDQRGFTRFVDAPAISAPAGGDQSDIGAYESQTPTAANGTISGRVTNEVGKAISGAVVSLSGTQRRKTITDANGNYSFANVENNGFYSVTPSRANYDFSPAQRSFSQQGNHTAAVFTGVAMAESANPLDTAEYFVRQQYLDLLGREPDEAGFNYWSDQINACAGNARCLATKRIDVAAAFFTEPEFQASGGFIYNVYRGSLGRQPLFSEFTDDRQAVVGGAALETEQQSFAAGFVTRPEFVAKYEANTNAESFVDALLGSVQSLGIDLNSQRDDLLSQYQAGANQNDSRAAVVRSLAESAVFKQSQYSAAFVLTEYFSYLRRTAEAAGAEFWLNVLNNSAPGNYRGMVCSFITAAEYQRRFSPIVVHSNAECAGQ